MIGWATLNGVCGVVQTALYWALDPWPWPTLAVVIITVNYVVCAALLADFFWTGYR